MQPRVARDAVGTSDLRNEVVDDVLAALHRFLAVASDPSVHRELRDRCRVDASWAEIHLMRLIGEMQPVTLTEVAAAFRRPEREVLLMVQELQVRGFVVRRPDRRARRVLCLSLTPAGRQADRARHRALADAAREILRDWDPDDAATLAALLARFTRGFADTTAADVQSWATTARTPRPRPPQPAS